MCACVLLLESGVRLCELRVLQADKYGQPCSALAFLHGVHVDGVFCIAIWCESGVVAERGTVCAAPGNQMEKVLYPSAC